MKNLFFSTVFLCIIYFFSPLKTNAQTWVEMMQDPDANFYQTVQEFEDYWSTHTIEKGKGYKPFRRWQDFMEPRVFPKGDVKQAYRAKDEFKKYLDAHPELATVNRAPWMPLGPFGAPGGGGAGRTNFVRIHPTNTNILFAGAPAGGLWKSTNGGASWTTNTDQLTVIGCTDVAIDPTNTNIMYLATGDGDAGDTYSIGVLKSTDGGNTWNPSGLTWTVTQGRTISKLLINPNNTQIVLAATSNGIYRSTNAGTSWTQVRTGNFKDMEFKPGDPTTVYACGTTFWRSTDSGATWAQVTSGVPASGVGRLAIAVTPANSAYVYLLAANNSNSGFLGIYRSTNSGTSFTTRATSPNLLGWSSTGSDSGGQGWYDLAIAASQTNADVVVVGGVNIWRSTNGGSSWSINGHWTGSGAPYVHADIHDLVFLPGSGTTYYSGNDGGVFRTTNSGGGWTDISANLEIAQQYELGLSSSNASLLVTGHQDNGTNKMNGTTWTEIYGGDGMQCFVDRTNNNVIVASYVYGDFKRSTNGGASWSTITSGLSGNAAWEAPIHQDPVTASTYYCGYQRIFKSTNNGGTWSGIGTLSGTGTVVEFDVAPSNTQVIYAVKSNAVFKTTNGGTSWTTITGTLPVGSAAITYVEISPTDPNVVYVTFSGYSTGNKIFKSTNGGTTWTNYSTGLPNLPVNCVVYQTGSNDGVYVGTDVGVYYRDNTMSTWDPYFTGLPNVVVKDLEIFYATGKIRAATFGRGTWETDLYSPGNNPPVANFTADNLNVCVGSTVNFTDISSYTPTSWSWDFGGGGTPNTSSAQNPSIVFNTPGTYTVTLTATNANGSDTEIKTSYITVSTPVSLPLVEGFENATFPPSGWFVSDINANGTWFRTTSAGGFGTSSASTQFDNYTVDEAGAKDELQTPIYDFTGYSDGTLTFDVAYARYNATYADSLAVLISTDCGQSYTQVYAKGSSTLATAPDVTTAFTPTATQWRTETVDLTPYVGNSSVIVVFQNRGYYGNMLYLDNINIDGTVAASPPVSNFSASPTAICEGSTVAFTDLSTGNPTSYSWSFPGGTPSTSTSANPVITYNTAGTYDVTLTTTNAAGSNTQTFTNYITVNPTPAANASSNSPVCEGSTINLSTTTVSGATYSWSGPGGFSSSLQNPTRPNATLAMGGTYTVTVTANGCTNTSSTVVTVNTAPVANASSNSAICEGENLNLTTTTVSGATYSWSGPGGFSSSLQNPTRPNATLAMSGTYTVTVTANGCTSISSTSVIVSPAPTANATSNSPVCSTQTINLFTTTVSGASYSWSGPGGFSSSLQNPTRPNATTAMSGTYTVTVTVGGCVATSSTVVTVNAAPVASASSNSPVCEGNTINLSTTTVSGATYSWSGPGGFSSSLQNPTRPGATLVMGGSYTVTVTANGCTNTSSTTVTVNPSPAANASSNSPVCEGNTINLATTTVSGASYSWSGPGGFSSSLQNPTRPNATLAMSGTYTVTVTANGCTSTSSTSVTVNPTPATPVITTNSPVCVGQTITFNTPAVSGATYAWSNQGVWTSSLQNPTRPNATLGMGQTYFLTVTVGGCTSAQASSVVVVNNPPTANASSTSPICSGQTINLTTPAVSGATFSWSGPNGFSSTQQNPSITNSTIADAGTYIVIVDNGCTASSSTSVTVNQSPTANATSNSPICAGQTLNLFTTTVSGATYSWSGPAGFSSSLQNPVRPNATLGMSGTYTVIVTANGCTTSSSTTVTVNNTPTANASSTSPVCSGQTISLTSTTVSGATYSWSGPNGFTSSLQNPSISNSTTADAGTYTVIVNNGCTASSSISVTVNPTPSTPVITTNSPVCVGQTISFSTPTVSGATYAWSNQGVWTSSLQNPTRPNATLGMGQTYFLTVTVGGCTSAQASSVVVVNNAPSTTASSNTPVCSGQTINLAATTVSGATYLWAGPNGFTSSLQNPTVSNANGVNAGTYTVTVNNGCTASSSTTVVVNASPAVIAAASSTTICEGISVTLTGSGALTYSWDNSVTNGIPFNPTATITYTVIGTAANGCTDSDQITVTVNPLPNVAGNTTANSVCMGDAITLTGSGASSYSWDNSVTDGVSFIPSITTTYTVTGTDANNCQDTDQVTVTVNPTPSVNYIQVKDTVCHFISNFQLDPGSPPGGIYSGNGVTDPIAGIFDATIFVNEGWYPLTYIFTDSITGCTDSSASQLYVRNCKIIINPDPISIGISENESDFEFTILPNPTTGLFTLTLPNILTENCVLSIYNSIGQVILSQEVPAVTPQVNLDLSYVARGVYIIKITSGNKMAIDKLIRN